MNAVFKNDHAKICEAWNQLGAIGRTPYLRDASSKLAQLTDDATKASRLFEHLLAQAQMLDEVKRIDGATGESNDLYLTARGKVMIVGTDDAHPIAVLGQFIAALLAGNEVFLRYPSQQALCEQVQAIFTESTGKFHEVMSVTNDTPELKTLLHIEGLAVVGAVGTPSDVIDISQDLAETDGILTQLVAVTDMQGCQEMFDPGYLERFTTERVKTINTTAIGGNASLIELGMG